MQSHDVKCSVCLGLYRQPVMLRCGHKFCRWCIKKTGNLGHEEYSCPECKPTFTKKKSFLSELPAEPENRQCLVHGEFLKYYCCENAVCASCCQVGEHRGHHMELLDVVLEKRKEGVRKSLKYQNGRKENTEASLKTVLRKRKKVRKAAAGLTGSITSMFLNVRKKLDLMEKQILAEISRQEEEILKSLSDLTQRLETEKEDLSRKIFHLEELCTMTDPRMLQGQGGETEYLKTLGDAGPHTGDLDVFLISLTIQTFFENVLSEVKANPNLRVPERSCLIMDKSTAADNILLSKDKKAAFGTCRLQNREVSAERFLKDQVLSCEFFSSGRYFWEVACEIGKCDIGGAYPTVKREMNTPQIGSDKNSWGIHVERGFWAARHNSDAFTLNPEGEINKVGIFLDYDAGRLSFYQLSDTVRHLHTFTTTFSEPLHATFLVETEAWVRVIS